LDIFLRYQLFDLLSEFKNPILQTNNHFYWKIKPIDTYFSYETEASEIGLVARKKKTIRITKNRQHVKLGLLNKLSRYSKLY